VRQPDAAIAVTCNAERELDAAAAASTATCDAARDSDADAAAESSSLRGVGFRCIYLRSDDFGALIGGSV